MSLGSYMCLNFWIASFTVEPLCVVSLTLSLSYRNKIWSAATTEQHPGWFLWFEGGKNKTMHKQNFSECILELKSHCNCYATGTKNDRHSNTAMSSSSFLFFFFFFSWLCCCCCYSYLDCAVKQGGNIILIVRLSERERRSKSKYSFLFISPLTRQI